MAEKAAVKASSLRRRGDMALALTAVLMILLMVVPLPPLILDVLLALNLAVSATTLLVTLYAEEPLALNAFPSLLLFITLFRLTLNLAATRLILSEGQAGGIIQTFGAFVTGGNLVVGVILFLLLTVVNFVVITKGAGRIAEVAARFVLDALPGKQLSIDADLNAGIIDESEAKRRRDKVAAEADFYGAMDGASKFVRGETIAGLLIVFVNVLGGLILGMAEQDLSWAEAVSVYVTLAVGCGLVMQIPALLISVGAGILMTRSSSKQQLGDVLVDQLFHHPKVLWMTAALLAALALVPGMPWLILVPMAVVLAVYAKTLRKETSASPEPSSSSPGQPAARVLDNGADLDKALIVDPLTIDLAQDLLPLAQASEGGLLERLSQLRRQVALELGVVLPSVRCRDNASLVSKSYRIAIRGVEVHRASLREAPDAAGALMAAVDRVVHDHAHELIDRQEVARLVDNARPHASAVIDELLPKRLTLGPILRVLQNLLREGVSIRDFISILEILADHAATTQDPEALTEHVRQGLSRKISQQWASEDGALHAVLLDPRVEEMLSLSLHKEESSVRLVLSPKIVSKISEQVERFVSQTSGPSRHPVVLTTALLRPHLKKVVYRRLPQTPVLSVNEIEPSMEVKPLGVITSEVLVDL